MDQRIRNLAVFILVLLSIGAIAQLPVPTDIGEGHPRCFGKEMTLNNVKGLIAEEEWAANILENTKNKVNKYLEFTEKQPDWLVSRLQMYWKTKHDQVYINGGNYSHAEGEAPVPTVKFIGGRGTKTYHKRPRLEDVLPYMDDPRGLYLERKDDEGEWEWVPISATSGIVASINREILGIARDAAFMYWYSGEKKYADLAYGILDTYLSGIFYLKEPIDLSHGHHQTLVAYTQFEVIQEHYIAEVTETYDFLHSYITSNHANRLPLITDALRKWADQVIRNGVSFNNWNLFQAGHVSRIALVLENDSEYADGRGAQYYLDQIMNQSSVRQWSMNKLIESGYDLETGIWFESPGYALGVLRDFIHFAEFYDRNFDIDLINELPVLRQAVISSVQYLFPDGYKVGFGDGHYSKLEPGPMLYMIENAQKFGKEEDEVLFTRMFKTFFDPEVYSGTFSGKRLEDLFAEEPLKLRRDIEAGTMADFTSPFFYAPNTSWIVQRQLFDEPSGGLMISEIGSLGNHQHSNGIAMELYGFGMPLGCEMGHGSSYFSIEYGEYYTQFPAHNTVAVNGKSKYPEMKANHPFRYNSAYPESGRRDGVMSGITFSDVSFLEPETYSDQRRVLGIIADDSSGYYIDIFRSKQKEGKDLKHEYFYHNLGQKFEVMDVEGNALELEPTEKMAFGDGDLMAYDYMWKKQSIETSDDFTGRFSFEMDDRIVNMNVWSKGDENREIFSVLSPKNTGLRHGPIPEKYNELPVPTMVIRQNGEAWDKPFVVVYEPALNGSSHIKSVDYFGEGEQVGIHVLNKSGKEDWILSNSGETVFHSEKIDIAGTYGVVSQYGNDLKMLLGEGQQLQYNGLSLKMKESGTMTFEINQGKWFVSTSAPAVLSISISDTKAKYVLEDFSGSTFDGVLDKKSKTVSFSLPDMAVSEMVLKMKN